MRKLLTILGSFGLIASTASLAVACKSDKEVDRFDTAILAEKIYNQILVDLIDNNGLSNINMGSIFDDIGDKKEQVLSMINDKISKIYHGQNEKNLARRLKMKELAQTDYDKVVTEISDTIASSKLYTEYTSSIISNGHMDYDQYSKKLGLNPSFLMEKNDGKKYSIWFSKTDNKEAITDNSEFIKWQISEEVRDGDTADNHVPTIEQLENSAFVVIYNTTKNKITDTQKWSDFKTKLFTKNSDGKGMENVVLSLDNTSPYKMNGQKALQYRFQEYFNTNIKSSIYSNVLSMIYLNGQMWNSGGYDKPSLYFSQNSAVSKKVQSWDQSSRNGYKSNLKMVWSFTSENDVEGAKIWDKIKEFLNNDGSIKNTNTNSLLEILDKLKDDKNNTQAGTDPYLKIAGFNGFVTNDGDTIKSAEGNLIAASDAYAAINKANGPSILSADNGGKGYDNPNQKNKKDFYIVLPLYMIDLLNDKSQTFKNGQTSTIETDATGKLIKLNGHQLAEDPDLDPKYKDKIADVKGIFKDIANLNIKVKGVLYTLTEAQTRFGRTWKFVAEASDTKGWFTATGTINSNLLENKPDDFEGLVGAVDNTHDKTIGNIALDTPVDLGKVEIAEEFKNKDGIVVDGSTITISSKNHKYGAIIKGGEHSLSLDEAIDPNLYTVNGVLDSGKTVAYNINMGANESNPNSLVKNGSFNFYNNGTSSLDINNLDAATKTSLLREIQYITSKDETVIENAKAAIYPQFIAKNDVLYKELYDAISTYLKDDILNNGVSD